MTRSPGSASRAARRRVDAVADHRGSGAETEGPEAGRGGGRLYVVATPIGNLGDLSPRAREVLASVSLVLAEDTRRVRQLLNHFGLATPARSLHEHNEAEETPRLLARLTAGEALALVSDAGTPLLADPGFRLVRSCREAGVPVFAVPGPSAVAAALSVAGLPPYPFTFGGFLPAGAGARHRALESLAALPHTLVLFVSPHRLASELGACAEVLGEDREAVLLAELTKIHERCLRATLGELARWSTEASARGEHTLVIAASPPPPPAEVTEEAAQIAVDAALSRGLSLPEARRAAANALGISRRELYELITRSKRDT
ncbi:MAG: 16S rRNA (cytidine(1402)-2'-O)-methyltransferase [Acidobacteriota bacterium]